MSETAYSASVEVIDYGLLTLTESRHKRNGDMTGTS